MNDQGNTVKEPKTGAEFARHFHANVPSWVTSVDVKRWLSWVVGVPFGTTGYNWSISAAKELAVEFKRSIEWNE
jgi:hypothetical protein